MYLLGVFDCNLLRFILKDSTDPMDTMFLLADNLYAKASVPPTDKVCLWLGVSSESLLANYEKNACLGIKSS